MLLQGREPDCEPATAETFDPERYLLANPDIAAWAAAGGNPRDHLLAFGIDEGRRQVTAAFLEGVRAARARKYARFANMLEAGKGAGGAFRFLDRAEAFPIAYGAGHHDLAAYQRESANAAFGAFTEEVAANPDKRYLDVGCGYRDRLQENCLYLEVYPSRSADLVIEPACAYPITDASLDGIGCFAVLEHVTEPWRAAAEFRRMLKQGGLVFIDWPFLQPVHGYPSHYYNATRAGLARMFDEGFEPMRLDTLDSQAPDRALTWILRGWLDGLTDEAARTEFMGKTVAELLAEPPRAPFWRRVLAATPEETRMTYACGNTLVARKR